MGTHLEREVKLRFDDPGSARVRILAAGASPRVPRRLQSDTLLDTEQRNLSARGQVLRVRAEPTHGFVTFKTPTDHPTLKVREEIETRVADGATLVTILERAGYRIWFRYEKFREEFTLGDAIVAIDETPIGTFVEIEGSESGVTAAAHALDRGPGDYILASYRELYVRACGEQGTSPTNMVFADR
jgi:adenylate cyclase class 2